MAFNLLPKVCAGKREWALGGFDMMAVGSIMRGEATSPQSICTVLRNTEALTLSNRFRAGDYELRGRDL